MSEWYEQVDNDLSISGLEQGDILIDVPVLGYMVRDDTLDDLVKTFEYRTLIILTQTCDLVNGNQKLPPTIMTALVSSIDDLLDNDDPIVMSGSFDKDLRSNAHPRLMLLPPLLDIFSWHIIDFGHTNSVDQSFYIQNAYKPSLHLRMKSPARENLSQMFARHVMRVALNEELFSYGDEIKKRRKERNTKKAQEEN